MCSCDIVSDLRWHAACTVSPNIETAAAPVRAVTTIVLLSK